MPLAPRGQATSSLCGGSLHLASPETVPCRLAQAPPNLVHERHSGYLRNAWSTTVGLARELRDGDPRGSMASGRAHCGSSNGNTIQVVLGR